MRKACLNAVYEHAKRDPRVLFIGSDLGPGTLADFQREMPQRFFMEGVSEQHIIGMAAGLALDGYKPYVNTIATFITRRCYEQVAIDLCLQNLPVRLIGNGGGLVYAPLGPTHLATDDLAIMTALPNMTVVAPCDAEEMGRLMDDALDHPGPLYIRLAKGGDEVVSSPDNRFRIGRAILMRSPGEVLFVSTGVMTQRALAAAERLAERGVECGVLHAHTVKPLDEEALLHWAGRVRLIVIVEEHSIVGGLGAAVSRLFATRETAADGAAAIRSLGLPDRFTGEYGSQDEQLESVALHPQGIADAVAAMIG